MNKRIVFVLLLSFVMSFGYAQNNDEISEKGFKKEKLFTGGNVAVSFGSGRSAFGLSPHFGYSLTNWLDAAVSLNFNYISQRDNIELNDKLRQTTLGPGAFIRVFPVKFLFAQAQFEHNFMRLKYIPATGSIYSPSTSRADVSSLLLGAGYTSGRSPGQNTYYYLSILVDVLKKPNSPYVDNNGRIVPVIRAGYNIALFQGKNKKATVIDNTPVR